MKTLDQYAKACGDLLQSELPESIPVTHLTNDSRKVTDGSLFMAIQGSISDGREYIEQAIANGAAAICYMGEERDLPVPQLRVSNDYHAFGRLAEFHFDYPANDLSIIGVTGTNGKTTTAYLLKEILQTSGRKVGLIGTVQYLIGDKSIKADRTTPTPCRLQELMAEMRKEKVDTLVMEISSHALIQKRLGDMQVDVAVFTNLTEEHLDFHKNMEEYYQAKKRLFSDYLKPSGLAVINIDDPYGKRLMRECDTRAMTYGIKEAADIHPLEKTAMTLSGSEMILSIGRMTSSLIGEFNVANTMAAIGCAWGMGIDEKNINQALDNIKGVPGRLQRVPNDKDLNIFVDYAHTSDALKNVLACVKPLCRNRLILVFGCGGDRDPGKRPAMAEIAAPIADKIIVTSDNPRTEDPLKIIEEIITGFPENTPYESIPDRRQAIVRALEDAQAGDTILIAGKGHEDYQEINGIRHSFEDFSVTAELLNAQNSLKKSKV